MEKQKVAWLLVLCMLPLAVTKLTHRHVPEERTCCTSHADSNSHESNSHDADNCFVCKFTLSPFLSLESAEQSIFLELVPFEPAYHMSLHITDAPHTYLLRGPPTA